MFPFRATVRRLDAKIRVLMTHQLESMLMVEKLGGFDVFRVAMNA